MEDRKLYWSNCNVNNVEFNTDLVEATKCKKCNRSRIEISMSTCNEVTSLKLKLNKCVMEEGLCKICDENKYYSKIKNPCLT